MSEDRAEGLDLDALKAANVIGALQQCLDDSAPSETCMVASADLRDLIALAQHDQATPADSVESGFCRCAWGQKLMPCECMKKAGFGEHDQATPGVEGWKTVPVEPEGVRSSGGFLLSQHGCSAKKTANDQGANDLDAMNAAFRAMVAAAPALPTTIRGGREEIARIIDPIAFRSWTDLRDYCVKQGDDNDTAERYANQTHGRAMDIALAKADLVLALPASIGVEEKQEVMADPSKLQPAESGTGPLPHANKGAGQ